MNHAATRTADMHRAPIAGQCWDAHGYATNAGFVPALGDAVATLLDPGPGERILDLGCGDGVLTAILAGSGATIIGVDASPELVSAARMRGIDARVMDGHALDFENEFDAVFSNAALHWMREPEKVLQGVHRALKPGGRFVAEFGGHGNVASIVTALRAAMRLHRIPTSSFAWFFPTPEEYAALLKQHGFSIDNIALVPRPTPLDTGMDNWLRTFANPFFACIQPDSRQRVIETTVELLTPSLCDAHGQWTADYVRLRFHATRTTN